MSKPLPYDSPLWKEMRHVYGSAEDIPDLLQDLELIGELPDVYDAEPMFSLTSSLFHQHDVFDASYAAFPHLVRIAEKKQSRASQQQVLFLAALIAAEHDDASPYLNDATEKPYQQHLPRALRLALELVESKNSTVGWNFLLGMVMAFKGESKIGRFMFDLDGLVDEYQELTNGTWHEFGYEEMFPNA